MMGKVLASEMSLFYNSKDDGLAPGNNNNNKNCALNVMVVGSITSRYPIKENIIIHYHPSIHPLSFIITKLVNFC